MNVYLSVKRIMFNKKEEEEQTFYLYHLIMDMFTHTDIFSTLYTQET